MECPSSPLGCTEFGSPQACSFTTMTVTGDLIAKLGHSEPVVRIGIGTVLLKTAAPEDFSEAAVFCGL